MFIKYVFVLHTYGLNKSDSITNYIYVLRMVKIYTHIENIYF